MCAGRLAPPCCLLGEVLRAQAALHKAVITDTFSGAANPDRRLMCGDSPHGSRSNSPGRFVRRTGGSARPHPGLAL